MNDVTATKRDFNRDFDSVVSEYGERTALVCVSADVEITYAELNKLVDRHLGWLNSLEVREGDCVGAVLPNSAEMLAFFLASLRGGFRFAPLACDTSPSEVARWAELTKPKCCLYSVLLEESRVDALRSAGLRLLPVTADTQFEYLRDETSPTRGKNAKLYLFTSGTTGEPKALVIDGDTLWSSGHEFIRYHGAGFDKRFRIWNYLPQSYLGGLYNMALIPFSVAGSVVVDEIFSGKTFLKFWQEIDRHDINIVWFVPTIVRGLMAIGERTHRQDKVSYRDRIDLALLGTAPIDQATKSRFEEMFGITLLENFALSETTFITSENSGTIASRAEGTVGEVLPYVDVKFRSIIEDDDDEKLREILVKTPYLMDGYLNADGTVTMPNVDGYFPTGDLGYVAESGQLVLTGRSKEIIKKGGYFIGLREIEVMAAGHADVIEAAATPVPHAFYGESYVLYVRLRPGVDADAIKDVRSYVFAQLAKHRWPESVEAVETFPRTGSGKVRKFLIGTQQ